jgi:hypothetical protein
MTCLKVKKEAKLEECAVAWSGDTFLFVINAA